jgi:hypothetical protein
MMVMMMAITPSLKASSLVLPMKCLLNSQKMIALERSSRRRYLRDESGLLTEA